MHSYSIFSLSPFLLYSNPYFIHTQWFHLKFDKFVNFKFNELLNYNYFFFTSFLLRFYFSFLIPELFPFESHVSKGLFLAYKSKPAKGRESEWKSVSKSEREKRKQIENRSQMKEREGLEWEQVLCTTTSEFLILRNRRRIPERSIQVPAQHIIRAHRFQVLHSSLREWCSV